MKLINSVITTVCLINLLVAGTLSTRGNTATGLRVSNAIIKNRIDPSGPRDNEARRAMRSHGDTSAVLRADSRRNLLITKARDVQGDGTTANPTEVAAFATFKDREEFEQLILKSFSHGIAAASSSTAVAVAPAASARFDLRTVSSTTSTPAPGTGGLLFSGDFSSPRVNANCDEAVVAGLTDPNTGEFSSSIWSNRNGSLEQMQMQSEHAPEMDAPFGRP